MNVTFVKKHPEASSLLLLLSLLLWLSYYYHYCYYHYHHHHCYYYYYHYYYYDDHHHYYYHSINNIPYQGDINCAGHFTLDALASRSVACCTTELNRSAYVIIMIADDLVPNGARPSASIMLTWVWLLCNITIPCIAYYCEYRVLIIQTKYFRGWTFGSPPVFCCKRVGLLAQYQGFFLSSRFAPNQWETSLQRNTVSHWLGASLASALLCEAPYDAFMTSAYYRELNVLCHRMITDMMWYLISDIHDLSKRNLCSFSRKHAANLPELSRCRPDACSIAPIPTPLWHITIAACLHGLASSITSTVKSLIQDAL